jgi:hypothetical protein
MTNALLVTPMHRRKPLKRFGDVREDDDHQTSGTE